MSGQPSVFDFVTIIPTELALGPLTPPFAIVKEGDQLTLRAYFHCGGDAVARFAVSSALGSISAAVWYYFQDLEAGGAPIKVPGGIISKMSLAQITAAFAAGGDLNGSGLLQTDDYYLSIDTAPITTGPGFTLQIPPGDTSGTWRVLTIISGGGSTPVSAFDENLFVEVYS
jgi:hypothetical protein